MSKLLLFDIDGTLISGKGIPKKVAIDVINNRFPGFKNGHNIAFNGMTDPLIVKEVLAANDYTIEINDPVINEILDEFMAELVKHVNPQSPPLLLPGVKELLDFCHSVPHVYVGLVTGNIMQGAKIKLSAINIYHYFAIGAFGSDHWNRNELPPIAVKRAQKYFLQTFSASDIWIIGDSPKDVECAKANDFKCLAVETGKVKRDQLELNGPDIILKDLTDLDKIIQILEI